MDEVGGTADLRRAAAVVAVADSPGQLPVLGAQAGGGLSERQGGAVLVRLVGPSAGRPPVGGGFSGLSGGGATTVRGARARRSPSSRPVFHHWEGSPKANKKVGSTRQPWASSPSTSDTASL